MQLPVAEVTRYIHRVGRTVLLACHFVASLWSHVVPVFWWLPMLPWVFILPALLSQKGNGSHGHGMIVMRLSQTFTLARKENSWTYSFTWGHVFCKSTERRKVSIMHICCSTRVPLVARVTRRDTEPWLVLFACLCTPMVKVSEMLHCKDITDFTCKLCLYIAFACFYKKSLIVLCFLRCESIEFFQMFQWGLCKNVWTPLVQSLAQLLRVELQLEKQRRPEVMPQAIHHMTRPRLVLTHSEDHPISMKYLWNIREYLWNIHEFLDSFWLVASGVKRIKICRFHRFTGQVLSWRLGDVSTVVSLDLKGHGQASPMKARHGKYSILKVRTLFQFWVLYILNLFFMFFMYLLLIYLSICGLWFVCLFVCSSVCLSVCLFVCLFVCLSVCLLACLLGYRFSFFIYLLVERKLLLYCFCTGRKARLDGVPSPAWRRPGCRPEGNAGGVLSSGKCISFCSVFRAASTYQSRHLII